MFKSRSWFGLTSKNPKNRLSLENLKNLLNVIEKNQVVTEQNKNLLIETLRCIAEILIWGDQNDGSVFE
jgi:protein CLEC16A